MALFLALGWFWYSRKHPMPLRITVLLAVLACLSTWLTARFAAGVDQRAMAVLFCLFTVSADVAVAHCLPETRMRKAFARHAPLDAGPPLGVPVNLHRT